MKKLIVLFWILFIGFHLINVKGLPIFEDEGEYLLLAEAIKQNFTANFLIYLKNGLLPMFGWLVAAGSYIFEDTLITGRVINVLLASSLVWWVLSFARLYKLKNFFIITSEILLLFSPIILLNSRIALLDTPVLVFTAWYIYFTAAFIQSGSKRLGVGLFLSLSAALLTKATAIFGILPVSYLLIDRLVTKQLSRSRFVKTVLIIGLAIILSATVFINFAKEVATDSGSSLITHLGISNFYKQIKANVWLTISWFYIYYGRHLPFLAISLLFLRHPKKIKLYMLMVVWIIGSLVFMILLNRFYYPRHLLLISLPLIVLICVILSEIPRRYAILLFLATFFLRLSLSYNIITNPFYADIALEDRFSYFEDYSSGKNVDAISAKLSELAKGGPILVWLDGSYVMEYGLRRGVKGNSNIEFKSFTLGKDYRWHEPGWIYKDPDKLTYLIVNRWHPENKYGLKLIEDFPVSFRHSQRLYSY